MAVYELKLRAEWTEIVAADTEEEALRHADGCVPMNGIEVEEVRVIEDPKDYAIRYQRLSRVYDLSLGRDRQIEHCFTDEDLSEGELAKRQRILLERAGQLRLGARS